MASTYSTNLAIELIGTGEQSGTWGTTTNTNLGTLIEQSISGYVTQAITDGSGANTTITIPNGATGVARNMFIEMTGALTFSTTSLIVPANKKLYFIFNNTSGGFAVTVKVSGQTGVLVPNGKKVILTSNGTDIVEAANQVVGAFGVGGVTTIANGSVSAPSLAFVGATTTGFYKGTGNAIDATLNGTQVLDINASSFDIKGGLGFSVTGTSTMAAINASDVMTISKTNSLASLTLQTLALADGYASLALKNLGGSGIVAISRSAGGDIFTGSTGYALNVGTLNAYSVQLGTNGVVRLTVDSAGAVTIPGAITTSSQMAVNAQIYSGVADSNSLMATGVLDWGQSYGKIRIGTDKSFNIDTYNSAVSTNVFKITQAGAVTIPGTLGVGDITTNGNNKGLYFNGTRNGVLGSNAADTVSIAAANANVAVFGAASTSLTGTLGATGLVTGDAGFAQIKNTGLMANGAQYTIGPAYATGMFVIREFQVSGDMAIYLFSTDASTPVRLVDGSSNWSAAPSGANFNVWMNGANLVIQNTAGNNRAFKYSLLYAG